MLTAWLRFHKSSFILRTVRILFSQYGGVVMVEFRREADPERHWEVAELLAALDPTIAPRLLAEHPGRGWCRHCRVNAPCPSRTLAAAVQRVSDAGGGEPSPA